ncbi:hypothetical protein C2G38_2244388 [Gigaspora rosea]|uniref:SAM domain-containing protein n=1 Tax=Gigaspora rosea TaxID=44941 RepID=A0A397VFZ2_9GLOM|nr:hypothetical protein C2G38_2244388 [Gigaspora rosea]
MESTKTYLIGTCYLCSRCLYCNKDTLLKTCECIKTQAPNKKNRTKEVPWAFKINYRENFSTKQLVLLKTQNEICNYNIDFSSNFQFSLCSSCNAKWYRARNSEIKNKHKINKYQKKPSLDDTFIENNVYHNSSYDITDSNYEEPIHKYETNNSQEKLSLDNNVSTSNNNSITDDSHEEESIHESETNKSQEKASLDNDISIDSNVSTNYENSSNNITTSNYKEETIPYDLFEDNFYISEDEDHERILKFTVKLCIKDQNGSIFPAKQLSFTAQSCIEFHDEIQLQVQDLTNNFGLGQNDYILAYKVTQEAGIGTQITNEDDFHIFTKEYYQAISKQKEVFILVTIASKKRKNKTTKNSNNNDNNKNYELSKKRLKYNRIPSEINFDQFKRDMSTIITILQEERFCNQCDAPCWPTNQGHIKLTDAHYTVWAFSIINGFNDMNSPPNHPIFQVSSKPRGIKARFEPTTPYFIPIPQLLYRPVPQTPFPQFQSISFLPQLSTSHYQSPIIKDSGPIPTLEEFFYKVDKEENANGEITKYLDAFNQEAIRVKQIQSLTESQFNRLGVKKIGWQIALHEASQRYK